MTDAAGQFWCSECQAFFSDAIQVRHEASHEAQPGFEHGGSAVIFWTFCVALGAAAGGIVGYVVAHVL